MIPTYSTDTETIGTMFHLATEISLGGGMTGAMATGILPNGSTVSHTSAWRHHPDYGITLLADRCRVIQGWDIDPDDDPYGLDISETATYMAHAGY